MVLRSTSRGIAGLRSGERGSQCARQEQAELAYETLEGRHCRVVGPVTAVPANGRRRPGPSMGVVAICSPARTLLAIPTTGAVILYWWN